LDGEEIDAVTTLTFSSSYDGGAAKCFCNSVGDLRGFTNLLFISQYGFPNVDEIDGSLLPSSMKELNFEFANRTDLVLTNLHNLTEIWVHLPIGSTVDLTGLTQPLEGGIEGGGATFVYVSSTTNFTGLSLSSGAVFVVQ
jgi:hypothetical protein